jgi:hypothetical protein
VSIDLSHLDTAVHSFALLDTEERIRMVSKDILIEHEYSAHLNDLLDALLCEPRHGRMPCWLITGDAGMGKTAHLHRFARRYADRRSDDNAALIRPIVIANVPPEPPRQTLEWCVLEALNAPTALGGRGIDRAGVIRRLLAAQETRVLILDEVQHLCHTRSRDRAVVLDSIKLFPQQSFHSKPDQCHLRGNAGGRTRVSRASHIASCNVSIPPRPWRSTKASSESHLISSRWKGQNLAEFWRHADRSSDISVVRVSHTAEQGTLQSRLGPSSHATVALRTVGSH